MLPRGKAGTPIVVMLGPMTVVAIRPAADKSATKSSGQTARHPDAKGGQNGCQARPPKPPPSRCSDIERLTNFALCHEFFTSPAVMPVYPHL